MLVIKSQGFGKITNGEYYISDGGHFRIMRETGLVSLDGDDFSFEANGRWVLRDVTANKCIDLDRYRNDLFERHNIRMKYTTYRNKMVIR